MNIQFNCLRKCRKINFLILKQIEASNKKCSNRNLNFFKFINETKFMDLIMAASYMLLRRRRFESNKIAQT